MKKAKKKTVLTPTMNQIILLSAWSFTLVISSFLFLLAGRWIDVKFNTEPTFMLGLLMLGIGLCIGRIYQDYMRIRNDLSRRKPRYPSQHIVKEAQ
jgi:F0F1-type ATP synthase assembly protein I